MASGPLLPSPGFEVDVNSLVADGREALEGLRLGLEYLIDERFISGPRNADFRWTSMVVPSTIAADPFAAQELFFVGMYGYDCELIAQNVSDLEWRSLIECQKSVVPDSRYRTSSNPTHCNHRFIRGKFMIQTDSAYFTLRPTTP
jgi:hypothetical protein